MFFMFLMETVHMFQGMIEETMVIVLRALQADPEVLLATMQVFVQEPTLDWLLLSRKHFEENEGQNEKGETKGKAGGEIYKNLNF